MLICLIIVLIFAVLFLTIYYPVLRKYKSYKQTAKSFQMELNLLEELYKKNIIIISKRLGEGPSQNSSVYFSEIHANQQFAIDSILDMIN